MPRLSEIGDSEDILNRHGRRVIVYVEADTDVTIFYGLTEPGIREYLEFKTPTSLATGGHAVAEEVRTRREQYPKTFGLIDGEDAAKFGAVDEFLACKTTMFKMAGGMEGLIFLGQHEAENVLILHGELHDLIRRDQSILGSAAVSDPEISRRIATVVRRFFQAALLKYASMTLNHKSNQVTPKSGCKVIDSARFLGSDDRKAILALIKTSVEEEGIVSWSDVLAEVKRTWNIVRQEYSQSRPDDSKCRSERMRLTDGKSVVRKLASLSGSDAAKWSNHLLENAKKSAYARQFRADLLSMTGA
jgi:hypothetical protein